MEILCFVLVLALEGLLFVLSRGERERFADLKEQEYPLKSTFLPMGHLLLKICGYRYNSAYDRKLVNRLAELHDPHHSRYYLQVHWAQKVGCFLLALLLGSFLLAAGGRLDLVFLAFVLAFAIAAFLAPDYQLRRRLEQRHLQIKLDFPEFVNKLVLLINAGMTVQRAWEKAAFSRHRADKPLYAEAARTALEIRSGKPEGQAYEEFARRCRVAEITRFTTVILQNLRKGNAELAAILRVQANECWEMRKHAAKRLGEEAETKLLLPLMLMFLAILLIVATPAVLALRGM